MSYIGQQLPADVFSGFVTDSFTGDGSATTFTLSKVPFSEDALIVVINNVIQKPVTNFTVSGTTLTIVGTAVASGDVIYAMHTSGAVPSTLASKVDVNGVSDAIILDADADTTISADTDDQIDFKVGGTDEMTLSSTGLVINEGSNDRDFRVESNGDTHMLFVDGGNDRVHIGNSTTIQSGGNDAALQINGTGGNDGHVTITRFSANASPPQLTLGKSRNGTIGSFTIVQENDDLGQINFTGDDGAANLVPGAQIRAACDGTPGSDDMPGRLEFLTTADGASSPTERMRINRGGRVGIGTTNTDHVFQARGNGDAATDAFLFANTRTSGATRGIQLAYSHAPDDTNYAFVFEDTSSLRLVINNQGDIYNHDNVYQQLSDERIKQNITDANSQWDDFKAIKFKNFERKDDVRAYGEGKKIQLGVVAQEIETVSPNLISHKDPDKSDIISDSAFGTLYEDGDDIPENKKIGDIKEIKEQVKGVKYSVLYLKGMKALQEAMAKIETLETKVKALEDA